MSRKAFKAHWARKPLSIDFDGVIHEYSRGWVTPEIYDPPMPGTHDALKRLLHDYAVHILTARDSREVIKWCRKQFPDIRFKLIPASAKYWEVKDVIGVTNIKLPAIAYVDDRGIRFTSWKDILNHFI